MLFDACRSAMKHKRFATDKEAVTGLAWTLADHELAPGVVYKTHDYPDALAGRDDLRSIFVFGLASEAALSVLHCRDTRGEAWVQEHFEHLKSDGSYDQLLDRDALGLGAQLDAWSRFGAAPVLCIRYEVLWSEIDRLREFTGLKIELPERRDRSSKDVDAATRRALDAVYGELDARIGAMPKVFTGGSL